MRTVAPSARKPSAAARPMPLLPPVTSTTLFSSSSCMRRSISGRNLGILTPGSCSTKTTSTGISMAMASLSISTRLVTIIRSASSSNCTCATLYGTFSFAAGWTGWTIMVHENTLPLPLIFTHSCSRALQYGHMGLGQPTKPLTGGAPLHQQLIAITAIPELFVVDVRYRTRKIYCVSHTQISPCLFLVIFLIPERPY